MAAISALAFFVALFGAFKPFGGWKRKHFGIAAAIAFVSVGIFAPKPAEDQKLAGAATGETQQRALTPESPKAAQTPTPAPAAPAAPAEPMRPQLSGPQTNAVRSAENYLAMKGFSKAGLIEQLSSEYGEGYSVADATTAVNSLDVDWNDNAVRSARSYLDMKGFSCNGLIEQLSSSYGDKYTNSQATYGARQAGAC